MPVLIKDYTWKQTDDLIIIRVPLKGMDPSKADIFTCDNFIKVHYPPFLFELCLRDIINEEASKCRIVKGEIIFELIKQEEGPWDVLEAPLTKAEILAVKQRAIELSQQRCETKKKKRSEKRQEITRLAVKEQISLDTKEREKIDALKEHEKQIAMTELELWKQKQIKLSRNTNTTESISDIKITNKNKNIFEISDEKQGNSTNFSLKKDFCSEIKKENLQQKEIKKEHETSSHELNEKSKYSNRIKYKEKKINNEIPSLRNSVRIGVSFTPRMFPTPSRESKLEDENEWLQKQAEARRKIGFVIEDLRPEEHDPVWLKDKGDSFYKVGNYLGAISAYSHGIKLNPKLPALYSNRAAAHLAAGNLRRVVQDTTKALELLTPCVEMNSNSRSLCHARRGTALCQLNMLTAGLAELEMAFKLCPNNKELEEDINAIREKLENSNNDEDQHEEDENTEVFID
ncbi:dynein axonemal assembly factor 4 [Lycorma delicatula]|uniref:dynein axonemal assembly factor 4 n=1 Tax=Lycorma delicatula TaxID=130591 RepID=UPI003F5119FA